MFSGEIERTNVYVINFQIIVPVTWNCGIWIVWRISYTYTVLHKPIRLKCTKKKNFKKSKKPGSRILKHGHVKFDVYIVPILCYTITSNPY